MEILGTWDFLEARDIRESNGNANGKQVETFQRLGLGVVRGSIGVYLNHGQSHGKNMEDEMELGSYWFGI